MIGVTLLAFEEVIRRYVFGATFLWFQDAVVYATLLAIFLYFGVTLKENAHLRLSFFVDTLIKIGGKWKRLAEIMETLASFVGLAFCVLFIWYGFEFIEVGRSLGRTT